MEIKNVEEFESFIKNNVKVEQYDIEEYKKELIEKAQQGSVFYELGSYETKSGHAESISFGYTYDYDEELDQMTSETITL